MKLVSCQGYFVVRKNLPRFFQ